MPNSNSSKGSSKRTETFSTSFTIYYSLLSNTNSRSVRNKPSFEDLFLFEQQFQTVTYRAT